MGDCEYTLNYDALGRVTARTDGEGNTTTFAYHPGGQIRTVTTPDGAKLYPAEYDVWGRPDSETDGNGNTTVYEKDRWGYVTDVIYNDKMNLYAYCGNNPVMYEDPSGYAKKSEKQKTCGSDDIRTDAEKRGLTYDTEYKYDTTGGYKNSRYADVVVYDSKGRVMEIHQVGRTTKRTGAPVSRERKAIRDIRSSVEYNGAKIIYHPYDR